MNNSHFSLKKELIDKLDSDSLSYVTMNSDKKFGDS